MQAVDTPGLFMTAFSMLLKLFSQLAANVRFATVVGSFLRQSLGAVAHILRKNIKSLTHYLALSLSFSPSCLDALLRPTHPSYHHLVNVASSLV